MAGKKGTTKAAGKRSRTASVSSTAGAITRSRRSKTPALAATNKPSSSPKGKMASQPAEAGPSTEKTHTGRALRSRTKGGEASPLRTGLEEINKPTKPRSTRRTVSPKTQKKTTTTTRRSNRLRTVSPAFKVTTVTVVDKTNMTEEEAAEQAAQQILEEATDAAAPHMSSPVHAPGPTSDVAHEDMVVESVEVDYEIHDAPPATQDTADAEIEEAQHASQDLSDAEIEDAPPATQDSIDFAEDSDVEILRGTPSVIELEEDGSGVIRLPGSGSASVVARDDAETSGEHVAPENTTASQATKITEHVVQAQAVEIEEQVKSVEKPSSPEATVMTKPVSERKSSPRKRSGTSALPRDHAAVSPGPEVGSQEGFINIVYGNRSYFDVPLRTAVQFYKELYEQQCTKVEYLDKCLKTEMREREILSRRLFDFQMRKAKLTQSGNASRPYPETPTPAERVTATQPEAMQVETSSAHEQTSSITHEQTSSIAAPPAPRERAPVTYEGGGVVPQPPAIDFVGRILEMQKGDVYDLQNQERERSRVITKYESGQELTGEESALIAQIEAEERAVKLERDLAETPGAFRTHEDLPMAGTPTQIETTQGEPTPEARGFKNLLKGTVSFFSPANLFNSLRSFNTQAVIPIGDDRVIPNSGSRKRKAETDLSRSSTSGTTTHVATPYVTRDTRGGHQYEVDDSSQDNVQDLVNSPSVKRQRVDRHEHQTPYYQPVLTPITERTNESTMPNTLQTPGPLAAQSAVRTGKRMSVRQARRERERSATPMSQARRDFAAETSNRRRAARERNTEEDDGVESPYTGDFTMYGALPPPGPGEKRRHFIAKGDDIPQLRDGFGFDYSDFSFEDDTTEVTNAEEKTAENAEATPEEAEKVKKPITPERMKRIMDEAIANYLHFVPVAARETRSMWQYPTDLEWAHRMNIVSMMHRPAPPPRKRQERSQAPSPQYIDRASSPVKQTSAASPEKNTRARSPAKQTRAASSEQASAASASIPADASAAATSTLAAAAPVSDAVNASAPVPATATDAAATPSSILGVNRQGYERYIPPSSSGLRAEPMVPQLSSSSESAAEQQPPTPTNVAAEFEAFKSMIGLPNQPERELELSPAFREWSSQPGWAEGMAGFIDRLDMPMSKNNCGV